MKNLVVIFSLLFCTGAIASTAVSSGSNKVFADDSMSASQGGVCGQYFCQALCRINGVREFQVSAEGSMKEAHDSMNAQCQSAATEAGASWSVRTFGYATVHFDEACIRN